MFEIQHWSECLKSNQEQIWQNQSSFEQRIFTWTNRYHYCLASAIATKE